jgi:hypothetical protein
MAAAAERHPQAAVLEPVRVSRTPRVYGRGCCVIAKYTTQFLLGLLLLLLVLALFLLSFTGVWSIVHRARA